MEKIESKHWDCRYTMDELFEINGDKCLLDKNFNKWKHDCCFSQFSLLFKNPNRDNDLSTEYLEIGIREDGFVYISDLDLENEKEYIEIEKKDAIKFMETYKNMLNYISDFEYEMSKYLDNNNCINILYKDNYSISNSQKTYFKCKNNVKVIVNKWEVK